MKCSSPTLKAGIVLSILGVSLIGCTRTPPDPPTPSDAPSRSDPFVAPAPNCDKTATLNHCGAFMPQYNEKSRQIGDERSECATFDPPD